MKRIQWIGLAAAGILLSGCGGNNDYTPAAGSSPDTIFAEACASCHGDKGAGKLGFLLKVAGSDAEPAAIAGHIQSGGPVMPAFPNINEADRVAIAAYLKSL
ncbi:c-type cytochrome [Magnetococcus sp. PR-3]|uniref:c-type cytochrome n=1 Tax=Magnetococcus sp. PR-3 TaxID=3120355 RepID=UPI002FCDF085